MRLILIALTVIFAAVQSYAAPSAPTPNTTTLVHGAAIELTGSNFGVKSPVPPKMWDNVDDNYTNITNGGIVPVGTGEMWGGYDYDVPVRFKTTNPRGRYVAKYTNTGSTNSNLKGALANGQPVDSSADYIYVSWWMYQSDNSACTPDRSNKWYRIMDNDKWVHDKTQTIIWGPDLAQIYNGVTKGQDVLWHRTCNNNVWQRFETHVDSRDLPSPATLILKVANQYTGGTPHTSTISLEDPVAHLSLLGFDGSNTAAVDQPTIDWGEVYMDHTPARVELCNAPTFSASTQCEVQIPHTTWIDGKIEINVNIGSLPNGSAYLYVIDADNNVSPGTWVSISSEVAPVITNKSPTGELAFGTTNVTNSHNTSAPATCRYSTSPGTDYDSMTGNYDQTMATSHTAAISGLTNGSSYNYYIRCIDGDGNKNTSDSILSYSVASEVTLIGDFSFEFPSYSADRSEGRILVNIIRNNGSDGEVTVDWWTTGQTAVNNVDYYGTNGVTVTFADGVTSMPLNTYGQPEDGIEMIPNNAPDDRYFDITLSNATGGATISEPNTVSATINGSGAKNLGGGWIYR